MKLLADCHSEPDILECLLKYDVSVELIEIELTESEMMDNFSKVRREIEAINALEIHLHINGFGTGYAPLFQPSFAGRAGAGEYLHLPGAVLPDGRINAGSVSPIPA